MLIVFSLIFVTDTKHCFKFRSSFNEVSIKRGYKKNDGSHSDDKNIYSTLSDTYDGEIAPSYMFGRVPATFLD